MKLPLGLLGSSLGMYAVIAGAVGVIGLYGAYRWQIRGLNNQIEKQTVALAIERGATAELRIGLSVSDASIAKLESTIRNQNASIELMAIRTKRAEAAATASALRALRAGAEVAATLRAPTTRVKPGYVEMNSWLTERFAR